ncbi:MAG TPA: alpha/beta hydrolase-fold protein [Terriglobales bacterium]|nr:alpha/beta hydrolase-fold protein [Terriglobales bacterium]
MVPARIRIALAVVFVFFSVAASVAESRSSQLVDRELSSKNFAQNKMGINPVRKMVVYLPAGYKESTKHYPVIYFLPNPLDGSYRSRFQKGGAQELFDQAIASGIIGQFILVSVDMSTPLGCSWYVNSPVTGNWEAFVVQELVPYIDANFRTLPARDSRAITGIFMGAYGAIRLGMRHPDIFGSIYAMHPVGTGSGLKVLDSLPNWDLMGKAKSIDDIKSDGYSVIFTSIFQAFLPNASSPPLYIDFPAHKSGDQLVIDSKLTERLRNNFFIESMVPQYAESLKSLRGFKFDWARSDLNQDHVYSNQALTHKLNEFGIAHEAEEYNGAWGEANWGLEGRFYNEVLPFFQKHLVFDTSVQ